MGKRKKKRRRSKESDRAPAAQETAKLEQPSPVRRAWNALRAYLATPKLKEKFDDHEERIRSLEQAKQWTEAHFAESRRMIEKLEALPDSEPPVDPAEQKKLRTAADAGRKNRERLEKAVEMLQSRVEKLETESSEMMRKLDEVEVRVPEIARPIDETGRAIPPEVLKQALDAVGTTQDDLRTQVEQLSKELAELRDTVAQAVLNAQAAVLAHDDQTAKTHLSVKRSAEQALLVKQRYLEISDRILRALSDLQ